MYRVPCSQYALASSSSLHSNEANEADFENKQGERALTTVTSDGSSRQTQTPVLLHETC